MLECKSCGAEQGDDGIREIGVTKYGGEAWCLYCRTGWLNEKTFLSAKEAEVMAYKQITGKSHEDIAEGMGIEKSTVDSYSQRAREKFFKAAETVEALESHI